MRLPGEAYESLYKLHPDEFSQEDGTKYGAFDRFRILADVAPYSDQFRMWKRVVSQMNQDGRLNDEMKDEFQEVMTQVREKKKKYKLYDRRFTNADIEYKDVTVTKILDQNTFLTAEMPNNPIKLAGVSLKKDDEEAIALMQQFVHEGAKLRIGVDADPLFRVRDDMMNTMRAVVYTNSSEEGMPFYMSQKGQNLNYMLANRSFGGFMGIGGENNVSVKDDGSATATQALFSDDQITVGKAWEFISHDLLPSLPIVGPIADKFLQVRSPVEQYKRIEVFGKAWRPWEEPISGWLQPMIETMASRNPLIASAQGYGIGWLAGRGKGKFYGKWAGALIAGGAAAMRVLDETTSGGKTWIPERREKEREINEYFDRLKYVKFKGLYEKAAAEAKRTEGVDLAELLGENEKRGKDNKRSRKYLELYKKQLAMQEKMGYGDDELTEFQMKRIRQQLKGIDEDRSNSDIGPHTLLALQYKAEYESTLYGADPNGDMTKIFRSLPKKDREFFADFMKAAPNEREEILRLVPQNERRFFQAKWGMDMDKVESNESYFRTHKLPGADWEGWRADTSLNDVKLKVVRNEGLELTEFGFWDSDVKRAEASGAEAVDINKSMGNLISPSHLEKVLRGAGLRDVEVTVARSTGGDENLINVAFDVMKDRSDEILTEINNNWTALFN